MRTGKFLKCRDENKSPAGYGPAGEGKFLKRNAVLEVFQGSIVAVVAFVLTIRSSHVDMVGDIQ